MSCIRHKWWRSVPLPAPVTPTVDLVALRT